MEQNKTYPIIIDRKTEELINKSPLAKALADSMRMTDEALYDSMKEAGKYPQQNGTDCRMCIVIQSKNDGRFTAFTSISTDTDAIKLWNKDNGELSSVSATHFGKSNNYEIKAKDLAQSNICDSLKDAAAFLNENHIGEKTYTLAAAARDANKYFTANSSKTPNKQGEMKNSEYANYDADKKRLTLNMRTDSFVSIELSNNKDLVLKFIEKGADGYNVHNVSDPNALRSYVTNPNIIAAAQMIFDNFQKQEPTLILSDKTKENMKDEKLGALTEKIVQAIMPSLSQVFKDAPMPTSLSRDAARETTDKAVIYVEQATEYDKGSRSFRPLFNNYGEPQISVNVAIRSGNETLTLFINPDLSDGVKFNSMVGYTPLTDYIGVEHKDRIVDIANSNMSDAMKALAAHISENVQFIEPAVEKEKLSLLHLTASSINKYFNDRYDNVETTYDADAETITLKMGENPDLTVELSVDDNNKLIATLTDGNGGVQLLHDEREIAAHIPNPNVRSVLSKCIETPEKQKEKDAVAKD